MHIVYSSELIGDRSTSTKAECSCHRESRMLPLISQIFVLLLFAEAGEGTKHAGCYYGVWAYARPGLGEFWPEDVDVQLCDVIYYGFGNILNDTFEVCSWDPWFDMGPADFGELSIKNCIQEREGDVWPPGCTTEAGLEYCHYDGIRRTIALKEQNPELKVLFSVGGWTAGGWIFSQMAQTRESRMLFIQSAVHFVNYFGFDGIDIDWEYPALDGINDWEPTDPLDKEHFSLLIQEMRKAFDHHNPPLMLTFFAANDPAKAAKAYEIDQVYPYVDWINVGGYDYHGDFDGYTGIDAPLYGKWEESSLGHPSYGFNIHDTVSYYLNLGVPADKISVGIHTESKGFILDEQATEENCPGENCPAGLYCRASGSPNMTYSLQEGQLFYYEVLQMFYNDTIPDAELPPLWPGLKPGLDHWTFFNSENGKEDGCYMAPYAYQGKYWISYDDESSVAKKARFVNHYGLKGIFLWEIDSDNFRGLFGKRPFTILAAINDVLLSGDGLTPDEILGSAAENQGRCVPEAPMCSVMKH